MKKKNILAFDFDGTLIDSTELENKAMIYALHKSDIFFVDEGNIFSYYGPTEKGIIKSLVNKKQIDLTWQYFLDYYKANSKQYKIPITILKLLMKLKKNSNLQLFLITGRSRESLDISLSDNSLVNFFVKEYTGSDEGINKDESIQKLIHDYGSCPSDILYIGDTVADINTMKNVNVDALSVSYFKTAEESERLNILNNGKVVTKLTDLEEYINYFI